MKLETNDNGQTDDEFLKLYGQSRACKKFCVNATEQVSDRIFECDHQTQS